MPDFKDLTGKQFGSLTVLRFAERRGKSPASYWLCRCTCGREKIIRGTDMSNGKIVSCGCHKDASTSKRFRVHGGKGTPEYRAWKAMKERCSNPNHCGYKWYGGRGIRVCDRWIDSFENFLADMGPRPTPRHSVDRFPNHDGNYEPGNCRWATKLEQRLNSSQVRLVAFGGKTQTVKEWSAELGMKYMTLLSRFNRGWSVEKALTQGVGQ